MRPCPTCDACGRGDRGVHSVGVMIDGLLMLQAKLCPLHADNVREAVLRVIEDAESKRPSRRERHPVEG